MDDRFGKETNPPKYYLVGKLNRLAFRYLQNPIIAMHCFVQNLSQIITREAELVDGGTVVSLGICITKAMNRPLAALWRQPPGLG